MAPKPGVQVPHVDPVTPPGSGPGKGPPSNWSGGTSGSGSNDAKEQKRYMQSYLQVIYNLYGKRAFSPGQQKLAQQAFKMRWAASTYGEMLRREDPMFVRSELYKSRVDAAQKLYQAFRPGRPVPHGFYDQYARTKMSTWDLQKKMEQSGWFKRQFAGWTEAQKAGSSAGMSPQTFINYRTMWNNALQNAYGRGATTQEQRMMFSAGMTGDEVNKNFADLLGGQESLKWATGGNMNRAQILRGALTNKFGGAALAKVMQSRQTQAGYMGSKNKTFDIGVDDLTGNLTSSRI